MLKINSPYVVSNNSLSKQNHLKPALPNLAIELSTIAEDSTHSKEEPLKVNDLLVSLTNWKEDRDKWVLNQLLIHLSGKQSMLLLKNSEKIECLTYKIFLCRLREALDKNPDDLNSLCSQWFTATQMLPFFNKLILESACTQPKDSIASIDSLLLSEKLQTVCEALYNFRQAKRDQEPYRHRPRNFFITISAKIETVYDSYDTLSQDNRPSVWAVKTYRDVKNNKLLNTTHIRTGVPLGPKSPTEPGIVFVPEYLAFLRHLKKNGRKLLVILHLNPTYYDPVSHSAITYIEDSNASALWKPVSKCLQNYSLAVREGLWIYMFQSLSKDPEFKECVDVALFPMDGNWLSEIEQPKDGAWNIDQLSEKIIKFFTEEKSPLILPYAVSDKVVFLNSVANVVTETYFASLFNSKSTLSTEQVLAFIGLFYSIAAEKLQFICQSHVIQRNCKDAVDRTMVLVFSELCENFFRLKKLHDPKLQLQIISSTCGPAFTYCEREILKSRMPISLAVAKHLESLPTVTLSSKASVHDEYTLENVELC